MVKEEEEGNEMWVFKSLSSLISLFYLITVFVLAERDRENTFYSFTAIIGELIIRKGKWLITLALLQVSDNSI